MKNKYFFVIFFLLTSCAQHPPQQLRQQNLTHDLAWVKQTVLASGEKSKIATAFFTGPMSLTATINYALEHNLDAAIAARQTAVKREALTGAYWRLLPSLMLSGESSKQNHYTPSSSMSWETKKESLEPSISHDQKTNTFSAELSWNMLNLAVDFQRVQQAENQVYISEYELRRAKQNLVLDITRAYLNCAIARKAMVDARQLIARAKERQQILEQEGASGISNPTEILNGRISIYKLQDNLRNYTVEAERQWQQLAKLLGVPPQTEFIFDPIEIPEQVAVLERAGAELRDLEREALGQRPEMFRFDLEEQDALKEADIALTQLFPSLTSFVRYSYDDNSYLSRHDWANAGLRLSWDLFTIPRLLSEKKQGNRKAELVRKRRQAQALAVVVQLNLALAEYKDAREGLEIARNIELANGELEGIINRNVAAGRGGDETMLLLTSENYLQARVKTMRVWADLMLAKARIYNSLGRDFSAQDMDISRGIMPAAAEPLP
ncbi:MAG: hypothetical protein CSB28_00470 [Desulfobacterales bacterium]|nr:MAG: hypothetical protein CSB28_00470 [Desulfobacterales bacterium]